METILFLAAAFLAEIIGTMAGFGSSTVFLPIALLFVDFRKALVFVAFLHIFGNVGRLAFFRHGLDRRLLAVFGIPSVLLTIAGALLVNYTPQELLKLALGIFLAVFAAVSIKWRGIAIPPKQEYAMAGGGLSGFLAGLIGTGGALRGAFLTAFGLPKEKYVATAAAIALAVDMTRIPIYFGSGFLPAEDYGVVPLLLVVALAGSYAGKRILERIPQDAFRKLVLCLIFVIGLKFIYEGLSFLQS